MKETYTQESLVQFMYHELSSEEALDMRQALDQDSELRAEFNDLLLARTQLPKVQFNPSNAALRNILQYSAQTAPAPLC